MELTLRLFLCPFKKARRFLDCHFCILAASLIAIYMVDGVVSHVGIKAKNSWSTITYWTHATTLQGQGSRRL